MNREEFLRMNREVGPNVANTFARDAGISATQVQLWRTQDEAMRNCTFPTNVGIALQRKVITSNNQYYHD